MPTCWPEQPVRKPQNGPPAQQEHPAVQVKWTLERQEEVSQKPEQCRTPPEPPAAREKRFSARRAEASPDTDNLILLARLYGLSLDELLRTGDTPEPPPQEEIVPLPPPESLPVPYRNRSCWLRFPFPALVVIAYLLMGFIGHWWHPGWLVFCSIPLYYAFIGGNGRDWEGAFPILIVLIYLLLGFFGHWWHPGWLIFLLIPLYYILKDK